MKKTEAGMEDGSDGISSTAVLPSTVKNGEVMANFPDVDCNADNETKNIPSPAKVNGDSNLELTKSEDESDSSDGDALIIDESIKPQKTKKLKSTKPKSGGFKGFKKSNISDTFVHTNPYFAESIFDLLEKSQEKKDDSNSKESAGGGKKINCKNHAKSQTEKKTKANPKLREYAQYLGLQPTVQFKCSKCSRSGFPSLASLNEHLIQCNESIPVTDSSTVNVSSTPSTNIRVTRKVFLCSACGTYYENWNLFLHMREVHKRYICLYCLGMFSHPDKLAVHIVSKHNCVPNHINTLDEFYSLHGEPCFLMCCECQRGFTERDNFFDHMCIESSKANVVKNLNQKQGTRQNNRVPKSKNIEHVTADSIINESDDISTDCATANDKPFAETNPTDTTVQTDNETDKIPLTETSTEDLISKCDTNMKNEDLEDAFQESNSSQLQVDSQKVAKEKSDDIDSNNQEAELKTSEAEHNLEVCDNLADFDDVMKKSDYDSAQSENNYSENVMVSENTPAVESEAKMEQSTEDETRSFDDEMNVSDQEEHSDPDILNDSFDMNILDEHEMEPSVQETKLDTEEKVNSILSVNEDETRKVPKVTLKLPKTFDDFQSDKEEDLPAYESDDSEKLTMEVDQTENTEENCTENNDELLLSGHSDLQVAGPDVSIVDLELEQPLDKFDIKFLLQKCLRSTVPTCVYCNHARRICVNGKQLGLHAIAEHRFSAIVNSITAEELIPESFVARIKDGLPELENVYFNLESNTSEEAITFSHIFECFQCRYSTMVHKELYLHNRKMHAKSILLCIMCKSNFYSYSELICHLCPGLYELDTDVHFRCCMCVSDELPSAFRLMVHLRKKHHACDVCLELCNNQSRLSNHVWKHKLHHLCYRCGIAYRNKPDITKHLFWKHGTESVLCKKCLQKKWPHVYHFCIPPTTFSCEECNLTFTRAVSLMVHKRLHANDKPHACTEEGCTERFISKKLLLKHEFKHREPPEEAAKPEADKAQESENLETALPVENAEEENVSKEASEVDDKSEKTKPKVDVYNLPELNLSESDSSDTEDETQKNTGETAAITVDADGNSQNVLKDSSELELEKPAPVLETIWDDFRNYQANKEKLQNNSVDLGGVKEASSEEIPSLDVILKDHDYCVVTNEDKGAASGSNLENIEMSVDHDYCFGGPSNEGKKTEVASKKKTDGTSSSNSSSDSDSSSCTCGSNCSCSSSSGSSSSSSDSSESDSSTSEGRRRQQQRRERRKQKSKTKKESENATVDVVATDNQAVTLEVPIQESDLETTESDTDEDFYDKQPQKLASKLLAEKKNQLLQMAAIGPYINGSIMDGSRPQTPSLPQETKPKKKSKSKKRKKKNKSSKYESENPNTHIPVESYPLVSPLTLTLPKNSPVTTPLYNSPNSSNILLPNINLPTISQSLSSLSENDSSLRASKRRRVPNKFYGYSSDEEQDKIPQPPVYKWRKVDLPSPKSPLVVPPITIKTVQTPTPTVDPISIRSTVTSGELRVQQSRPHLPPISKVRSMVPQQELESGTDSNDSSSEEEQPPVKEQPALYCYCRCPYDEVSEMIGCDASDCAIEWFHFECVGIMVPPKGQWFCPDCRKKKQQRREMLQNQL